MDLLNFNMKTIFSPKHKLRNSQTELYGGQLVRPFECPERMDYIISSIENKKVGEISEPSFCDTDIITKIHDKNYISFLERAWGDWVKSGFKGEAIPSVWPSRSMPSKEIPTFIEGELGYYCLASETSISKGTFEAAISSASVALTGAKIVSETSNAIFSLCRPPGHHASKNQYGGYCFINNAAISAQYFLDNGAKRVAILDVDFHHGNGTQDIFYDRSDVMFLSLHGDPKDAFPHFLGYENETGAGDGDGYNFNFPMPPNTSYGSWSSALSEATKKIAEFRADALILSLGVDTFKNDPISFFKLNSEDFIDMGKRIKGIKLPTLFVMEGGYAIEEIGINTVNTLIGFEEK